MSKREVWPEVSYEKGKDTYATLHMWSQIVGKISLKLTPLTNHFWNTAFHVTARGLETPLMEQGGRSFTIEFNFLDHHLDIKLCDGPTHRLPLRSQTVADFYEELMAKLRELGIDVKIWTMPVEVPEPIRFTEDTVHKTYEPEHAQAFWRALVAMDPVFKDFRGRFLGKNSPTNFFWGSFDLALTRFSGKRAPERPNADAITKEAYSHEVISAGFWAGSGAVLEAAFYAYAAPAPDGFAQASVKPPAAYYQNEMGLFILPYEAVRTAISPEADLMDFLQSTYEAGANLGQWNRAELER